MKIIKYILFATVLVTLYITEPLWRVQNNTEVSQIDKEIKAQQDERNHLIAEEAEKLRKIEEKIGKKPSVAYKSRVPKPLQDYWDQTLRPNQSIYEDICSALRDTDKGWMTSCQYKIKNGEPGLKLDTYIIKNGKVIR